MTQYPDQVNKYIMKELKYGTLMGPYVTSTFTPHDTGTLPLATRLKKSSAARRVIMDLSWP